MKYLLIFLLSIIISGMHSGVASTPAYKVKPVENHIAVASKKVAPVTMAPQYHATAPVYVSPVPKTTPTPVNPPLVQPTIPTPPVISTPQNTNPATPDCAPTATVQDPCKLGQCFGYPYGICEFNPAITAWLQANGGK